MQNNRFLIFVIFLIFSTSFNWGLQLKVNDRRPASARGLISFPRIGRSNSEMMIFPRSERSFGLILKPRNGRSDPSRNFGHLNQNHHSIPDIDINFYALPNQDFVTSSDHDYEEYVNGPLAFKYADKIQKDASWLMADPVHKDFRFTHRTDDPEIYYSNLQDSRNIQEQEEYSPRLGLENEHGAVNYP
ncbi:CAPA peptides-like [Pseudomyrmex gracilis]|uniref:CAPA peptides-like n=1 Tax=Pseudomyrmex gracilis TaxID=219809 RepID=UPI0009955579|nr:CAPA peptides-like [Pseudomyrmex gracilis]